jgi:hypothetical protein
MSSKLSIQQTSLADQLSFQHLYPHISQIKGKKRSIRDFPYSCLSAIFGLIYAAQDMSALEVRQVKRPRLSLSCSVCRIRKVRCGREQPECTNCLRMNKKCVYESLVRDKLTGRLRLPSPSPQDKDLARLDLQNNPPSQAKPVTVLGDVRPTQSHSNRDDSVSTGINSNSDLIQPLPREHQMPLDKVHPKVPTWEKAIQGPVNHDASAARITLAAPSDQRLSSPDHRPYILSPDYLSLRRGGRVRYVGKAFWGFVPGQVRSSMQQCHST